MQVPTARSKLELNKIKPINIRLYIQMLQMPKQAFFLNGKEKF
jgi:hypothetical protein